MPTKQNERCYECYKKFLELDFSMQNSCPVYQSMQKFIESPCNQLFSIMADEMKAQKGDPQLGSGANIVKMRAERGDIEVDMSIFNKSLDGMCHS